MSIPLAAENQVLVNSLLSRYDIRIHAERREGLIHDMEHVRREADGTTIKTVIVETLRQQADALILSATGAIHLCLNFSSERAGLSVLSE
jgi:hypothetical protein